ncbi:TonB-dependent receptor [Pedobacter metabolipauper]|uniref:Outer membrane receptor protein involved in Fe transport n=1 Tax=Pedobacter metabolipauper TaxID=425513 RepID=A0A4R6T166_9SPHI|nr:TonB-dependent receptor [Pedobacter metabolipauper]TDQ12135.1 outer membrane receptor protein involved in Fe transport [Pedobacter metabolipauper]
MLKLRLLLCMFFLGFPGVSAQPLVKITGLITDDFKNPLSKVTVTVLGQSQSTISDDNGLYNIYSSTFAFTLKFSLLGYKPVLLEIKSDKAGRILRNVKLNINSNELEQVTITSKTNQLSNSTILNVNEVASMPSVSGNFEVILKTLPGVSTNNELSSQYSVRGGSFDENLVYVNDVEINRPVLIRNGQQEGLSFINSDLLSSAKFSAGGFESKYGDKLSSVLDVRYDKPDSSQAIFNMGLLGASFSSKILNKNSYLLAGLRYKNNSSVLNTQDNRGSYAPNFTDVQAIYHQNLSDKFNLSFLGSFNSGIFKLIPEDRETQFGTLNTLLRLQTVYAGKEVDDYQTAGGAVTVTYIPKPNLVIRMISSYFNTVEREHIDIEGQYIFAELNNSFGNGNFGTIRTNKGRGSYFNYARNNLESQSFSTGIKIDQTYSNHTFAFGMRFEQKDYTDDLNEYSLIDSAGYILQGLKNFYQDNLISVKNKLSIQYYTAYIQDSYQLSPQSDLQLGVRANFNTLSSQLLLSPRLLIAYRSINNTKIVRFTAGVYQQAPDYRSIRNFNGLLNLDQKAQRSYNTSVGMDYAFDGLGTRLKFASELYFKYQDRLIPYMMDNVRVKYLADNEAQGYTYGADFSIGGEFVKDLLSYFRVSLMKANQNILKDGLGFLRRPTDQRVNFSVYFQDRLLNSPTYKVHLNMLYGSRLPVGAPLVQRYNDDFNIPAYKRVDIGFSKDFLDDVAKRKPRFLEKYFNSFSVHAEVFNLLNINNTVSYLWLKDVSDVQYAIPNYLTGRQLNLKLIMKFKNSRQ